jgi:hypothetical protein
MVDFRNWYDLFQSKKKKKKNSSKIFMDTITI